MTARPRARSLAVSQLQPRRLFVSFRRGGNSRRRGADASWQGRHWRSLCSAERSGCSRFQVVRRCTLVRGWLPKERRAALPLAQPSEMYARCAEKPSFSCSWLRRLCMQSCDQLNRVRPPLIPNSTRASLSSTAHCMQGSGQQRRRSLLPGRERDILPVARCRMSTVSPCSPESGVEKKENPNICNVAADFSCHAARHSWQSCCLAPFFSRAIFCLHELQGCSRVGVSAIMRPLRQLLSEVATSGHRLHRCSCSGTRSCANHAASRSALAVLHPHAFHASHFCRALEASTLSKAAQAPGAARSSPFSSFVLRPAGTLHCPLAASRRSVSLCAEQSVPWRTLPRWTLEPVKRLHRNAVPLSPSSGVARSSRGRRRLPLYQRLMSALAPLFPSVFVRPASSFFLAFFASSGLCVACPWIRVDLDPLSRHRRSASQPSPRA